METILITGSNGLIGKPLCEYLNRSNLKIKGLDLNLPLDHRHYGDINNLSSIHHHIQNCIGVVHLAGVSRVIWGEKQPEYCLQTNVIGTQNLLDAACASSNKPWFLYASSREVYGQQQQLPVKESAQLQPLNTYARSKVAAEELVKQYRSRGLNTAILRFSSVYGRTDDHPDRVTPAFCRAAATGLPLRVDGFENALDLTHIKDVVEGVGKAIHMLCQGKTLPTIHLTTGKPTTLRELALLACTVAQGNSELIEAPPRKYDTTRFYGDPSLAREILGWVPKICIADGVAEMVKMFREQQSIGAF